MLSNNCIIQIVWGVILIGDVVVLSDSESKVKESFNNTKHVWNDQMKSMLGKRWQVLDVLQDGIIALPSADGSQDGTINYFHQSVVQKSGKILNYISCKYTKYVYFKVRDRIRCRSRIFFYFL